jgi:hypothetical protein
VLEVGKIIADFEFEMLFAWQWANMGVEDIARQ